MLRKSSLLDFLWLGVYFIAAVGFYAAIKPSVGNQPALNYSDKNISNDIDDEVITYRRDECSPGLLLYTSERKPIIYLMNLEGEHVHRWVFQKRDLLTAQEQFRSIEFFGVEPLPSGSLLANIMDQALVKLSWSGKLQWKVLGRFHHDIAYHEDKAIYALARREEGVIHKNVTAKILNDVIVVVSPNGKKLKEISLFEVIRQLLPVEVLHRAKRYSAARNGKKLLNDSPADFMHTNSLDLVKRDIPGVAKRGDLLFSMRELNLVGVIDPQSEKLRWHMQNLTDAQHDAQFLDNGNLLIFDNGRNRGYSQVLEIEPQTLQVVWKYGKQEGLSSNPFPKWCTTTSKWKHTYNGP